MNAMLDNLQEESLYLIKLFNHYSLTDLGESAELQEVVLQIQGRGDIPLGTCGAEETSRQVQGLQEIEIAELGMDHVANDTLAAECV